MGRALLRLQWSPQLAVAALMDSRVWVAAHPSNDKMVPAASTHHLQIPGALGCTDSNSPFNKTHKQKTLRSLHERAAPPATATREVTKHLTLAKILKP